MERKYQCKNVVASGHSANNLSRHNLLQWINDLLGVKIRKVEDLCSGAVYCQFMDILFPGCIPLKKIKLDATVMNEYWSNFKTLQMAFRTVGCEKDVPIDKLIAGRFQENFEFLQWFRRFYDANVDSSFTISTKSKQAEKTTPQAVIPKTGTSRSAHRPVAIVVPVMDQKKAKQENLLEEEIKAQIAEYQERAVRLQQEKDFFFTKLRKIEILCNLHEGTKIKKEDLVDKILAELYDTSEGREETSEEA